MFSRNDDPLVGPVQKVMKENALRREVVAAVLKEMDAVSVGQLTIQNKAIYEKVLNEVTSEVLAEGFAGNIQEVSKEKLRAYASKAGDDYHKQANDSFKKRDAGDVKGSQKAYDKSLNRHDGRMNAVKKLSGQAKVNASEETQIDEVSKEKLDAYGKKAYDDVLTRSRRTMVGGTPEEKKKFYDKLNKKVDKRFDSMTLAVNKQHGTAKVNASEEVEQIDELSKDTYNSYIVKATKKTKSPEYDKVEDDDVWKKNKKRFKGLERAHTLKYKTKSEEVEPINELSKATLGSYIKKASKDAIKKSDASKETSRSARDEKKPDVKSFLYKHADKLALKADNRTTGIEKATDKLTKEETLSELSKGALGRYIQKSASDMNKAAFNAGRHEDQHGASAKKGYDANVKSFKRERGISQAANKLAGFAKVKASNVSKARWDASRERLDETDSKKKLSESSKEKKKKFLDSVAKVERQSRAAGGLYWDNHHPIKDVPKAKEAHGRRMDLAKKVFKRYQTQEETISELSHGALASYMQKSAVQYGRKQREADETGSAKAENTAKKRHSGLVLAMNKRVGKTKVPSTVNEGDYTPKGWTAGDLLRRVNKAKEGSGKRWGAVPRTAGDLLKLKNGERPSGSDTRSDGKPLRVGEQAETISEISRDKVSRYIDAVGKRPRADQLGKHEKGINNAINKLYPNPNWSSMQARVPATKEETEINEIQKMTVNRYISKAVDSAHKLGKEGTKKADDKVEKRKRGVACAVNKLHGVDCKVPAGRLSDGF